MNQAETFSRTQTAPPRPSGPSKTDDETQHRNDGSTHPIVSPRDNPNSRPVAIRPAMTPDRSGSSQTHPASTQQSLSSSLPAGVGMQSLSSQGNRRPLSLDLNPTQSPRLQGQPPLPSPTARQVTHMDLNAPRVTHGLNEGTPTMPIHQRFHPGNVNPTQSPRYPNQAPLPSPTQRQTSFADAIPMISPRYQQSSAASTNAQPAFSSKTVPQTLPNQYLGISSANSVTTPAPNVYTKSISDSNAPLTFMEPRGVPISIKQDSIASMQSVLFGQGTKHPSGANLTIFQEAKVNSAYNPPTALPGTPRFDSNQYMSPRTLLNMPQPSLAQGGQIPTSHQTGAREYSFGQSVQSQVPSFQNYQTHSKTEIGATPNFGGERSQANRPRTQSDLFRLPIQLLHQPSVIPKPKVSLNTAPELRPSQHNLVSQPNYSTNPDPNEAQGIKKEGVAQQSKPVFDSSRAMLFRKNHSYRNDPDKYNPGATVCGSNVDLVDQLSSTIYVPSKNRHVESHPNEKGTGSLGQNIERGISLLHREDYEPKGRINSVGTNQEIQTSPTLFNRSSDDSIQPILSPLTNTGQELSLNYSHSSDDEVQEYIPTHSIIPAPVFPQPINEGLQDSKIQIAPRERLGNTPQLSILQHPNQMIKKTPSSAKANKQPKDVAEGDPKVHQEAHTGQHSSLPLQKYDIPTAFVTQQRVESGLGFSPAIKLSITEHVYSVSKLRTNSPHHGLEEAMLELRKQMKGVGKHQEQDATTADVSHTHDVLQSPRPSENFVNLRDRKDRTDTNLKMIAGDIHIGETESKQEVRKQESLSQPMETPFTAAQKFTEVEHLETKKEKKGKKEKTGKTKEKTTISSGDDKRLKKEKKEQRRLEKYKKEREELIRASSKLQIESEPILPLQRHSSHSGSKASSDSTSLCESDMATLSRTASAVEHSSSSSVSAHDTQPLSLHQNQNLSQTRAETQPASKQSLANVSLTGPPLKKSEESEEGQLTSLQTERKGYKFFAPAVLTRSKARRDPPVLRESSDVKIGPVIGSGSFGFVKKCTIDKQLAAVKIVQNKGDAESDEAVLLLKIEIEILTKVPPHEHIVRFLGHEIFEREVRMYMEYLPYSLHDLIKRQRKSGEPFSHDLIKRFAMAVARAILHIHKLPIPVAHRDIKASNVLVDCNEKKEIVAIKLCDFGVSKFCPESTLERATSIVGTPGFIAPEIRSGAARNMHNIKADSYSFGVYLVEIIQLEPDMVQRDEGWLHYAIDNIPDEYESYRNLIEDCIQINPSMRPSFETICETMKEF